jgi:hypothetical protein
MSFSGKTDGPDEATQHDFLDAARRWNADEKGNFQPAGGLQRCGIAAYGGLLRGLDRQYEAEASRLFARFLSAMA